MARLKKIVTFLLPVHFRADTEKGLQDAIREFRADPVYQSDGVGPDGYYGWTHGRITKKPKRRPASTNTNSRKQRGGDASGQ